MATKIPKPSIYIYKEINVGKYSTTKHFELVNQNNDNDNLTNLIKISKDRGFAKSNPLYWLNTQTNNKWNKRNLTGLFKTSISNLFKGDIDMKKNLLLIKFSEGANSLTVYCFKNYYTSNLDNVLQLIY
ncbi:MAG: hypothetical protein WAO74_12995 [Polaribacter sp.]|uniref:hypothetical protein n=1 Tax=Polaribacter sp. TaxID=1920175 RepID=UPI003BAEC0BD